MPDVWIGHQALDLELRRGLQACGHHDETVVIETPVAYTKAIQALLLAELREFDELPDRIHPPDGRQVAEGELHRFSIPKPGCLASRGSVSPRETLRRAGWAVNVVTSQ